MKVGEISTVADSGETGEAPAEPDASAPLDEVPANHYELEGVLARGGAGVVIKARDRRLRRQVAVKQMLRPDERMQGRFEREALLTARLQHPGIVPIYEAGRWPGGESFYAMRLVEGRPLSEVIADCGSLDERLALLPKVVAVCDAVAYAHTERVIHRDLKPHNVVIGPFGEVVVIDWGLAKDLAEAESPSAVDSEPGGSGGQTVIGSVIGTPAYMPPEQARGEPVDQRADVYSLGSILYHLIAGSPPFKATTNAENLNALLIGPPAPVEEKQPGVPRDLAALIGKAMARSPADRYADAGELSDELRRFVTGQLVQAHRFPRAVLVRRAVRRHPLVAATGIFALLLVLVGGLALRRIVAEKAAAEGRGRELLLGQARAMVEADPTASVALLKRYPDRPGEREAVRAIALDAESRGVARHIMVGHDNEITGVAIAPDGKEAASVGNDGALFLWDLVTGRGQRIEKTRSPLYSVGYDPTGRYLAASYGVDLGVLLWDRRARVKRRLTVDNDLYALAFSPDGSSLAGGDIGGRLFVWSTAGGPPRVLEHGGWIAQLLFSSDGRSLVSISQDGTGRVWNLATGESRVLLLEGDGWCAALSPDDSELAIGQQNGHVRVFSLADPARPPRDLIAEGGAVEFVAYAPDGASLAWIGRGRDIHVADLRSGQLRALHGHDDDPSGLVFLPDGQLVTSSADATVRVWDLTSGMAAVLRGHRDQIRAIAVHGESRAILSASHDRELRLWQLPPPPQTYRIQAVEEGTLRGSRSNDVLYFQREAGGLGAVDLRSHAVHLIEPARQFARASGDAQGRRIAYRDLTRKVALIDLAGGAERPLPLDLELVGAAIEFLPDGKTLAFPGWTGIHLVDVETLSARELPYPSGRIDDSKPKVRRLQFSTDGRRVLATRSETEPSEITLWDAASGRATAIPQPEPTKGALVIASPALDSLAAGTVGGLWLRAVDGGAWRRLLTTDGEVAPIAFSPDGSVLAAADVDGHLWLWRVLDGAVLHELIGHQSAVRRIEFSPDGGRLVSAGRDGATRIWDVAAGQALAVIRAHDGREVEWAGFHGDEIFTVGRDGTIRVWRPVAAGPRPVPELLESLTSVGSEPEP